jgi:hypothetical protein
MPEEKKYTSFHAPIRLLKMLDKIMAKRNQEVGVNIWSRNRLIVKALEEYYKEEIMKIEAGEQEIVSKKQYVLGKQDSENQEDPKKETGG